MTWTLVGYFPKLHTPRPLHMLRRRFSPDCGFACSEFVEEICSVSHCIAKGPPGWRDQGKHNFYDMYNNPNLAWSVVPAEIRADFELFAYWLYLVEFKDGQEEPIEEWWELTVEPMPGSFVRLGWDAVEGGQHCSFGCSPMSCNAGCKDVEIAKKNRYCLVSTAEEGIDLARHFSICQPEPGPYCVVEVWREASYRADPVPAEVTKREAKREAATKVEPNAASDRAAQYGCTRRGFAAERPSG
jgi:hypothetical protein